MTKEMYESLKVTDLRGIAKQRGLTVNPRVKKAELIDMMLRMDTQAALAGQEGSRLDVPLPASGRGEEAGNSGAAAQKATVDHGQPSVPAPDQDVSEESTVSLETSGRPAAQGQGSSLHEEGKSRMTPVMSADSPVAAKSQAEPAPRQRRGRPPKKAVGEDSTTRTNTAANASAAPAPTKPRTGTSKSQPGRQPHTRTAAKAVRTSPVENAVQEQHGDMKPASASVHDSRLSPSGEKQQVTFPVSTSPVVTGRSGQDSPDRSPAAPEELHSKTVRRVRKPTAEAVSNHAGNAGQNSYSSGNSQGSSYNAPANYSAPAYGSSYTQGTQSGSGHTDSAQQSLPATSVNPNLAGRYERRGLLRPDQPIAHKDTLNKELDSGEIAHGILEVMPDGFGFIRSANYMPGEDDVYVAPSQIRRFNLKTGDVLEGNIRVRTSSEKFSALLFVKSVNGLNPEVAKRRFNFEDMTPIFPDERIRLEQPTCSVAMRVMDLFCPVGKGQRGMIVSPPKAGKTTLVKEIAKSVKKNNPEIHLIILLIDERPEEVTDIREALEGPNVEVIYSTFDELPEHHKRVSEMTIERAKRLVEQKQDVMILLDSITRLTRAYNLTEPSSGRTLTGGLDPVALHAPKRFFGAARNMREGGSLTILATALIETGSKMDDVVYEEFKGTGNMELILNRKLSERRIFPAIDLAKSGTRRDDLLLTPDELEAVNTVRRAFIGSRGEEATDSVLDLFAKTRTNGEFVSMIRRHAWAY